MKGTQRHHHDFRTKFSLASTCTTVLLIFCFLESYECFSARRLSSGNVKWSNSINTVLSANLIRREAGDSRKIHDLSQGNDVVSGSNNCGLNRRKMISSLVLNTALVASASNLLVDNSAAAADDPFARYRSIPTFCIVNGAGVPYMIFQRDNRSATGYLFMSYQVAVAVLEDAKKKEGAEELWSDARIVTIPLSIALKLEKTKLPRRAINFKDEVMDTYNDIVPSEEGVADAKFLDKKNGQNAERWNQKGRIPLFFVKNNELPVRYYFTRKGLTAEWTDTSSPPNIQVTEMSSLFGKTDPEKIQLVPVAASQKDAEAVIQKQKGQPTNPYSFKDVVIVSSVKK